MATTVLDRWTVSDSFADRLLRRALVQCETMPERDRALATELVNGVFRHRGLLDREISSLCRGDFKAIPLPVLNRVRVGLYQIRFLERVPHHAAVHEAVSSVKRTRFQRYAGLTNALLRAALRTKPILPGSTSTTQEILAVLASLPVWLADSIVEELGDAEALAFGKACIEIPAIFGRVNTMRAKVDEVLGSLEDEGVTAEKHPVVPDVVQLPGSVVPELLQAHRKGMMQIQDPSSTLIGMLVDPRKGEVIVDACCAPGGKLAHLHTLSKGKATIYGFDKSERRLRKARENLERLGIPIDNLTVCDILTNMDNWPEEADAVLVDVPCSGTGTIRRRVDLKWRLSPDSPSRLAARQMEIIHQASTRVAAKGRLIYSTCSVLKAENEEIVDRFLEDHPDFKMVDAKDVLPKAMHRYVDDNGAIRTWPHRDGLDGVYAALLVKSGTKRRRTTKAK